MKPLVVSSLHQSAGKSSTVIGLAKAVDRPFAYIKPFGDRLLYKKKRQWDYDAALIANLFELEEIPELITLGFDHSKLRFKYTPDAIAAKLQEMADAVRDHHDLFFIEAGRDFAFGASLGLDPVSLAQALDAQLLVVLQGNEARVDDELAFLKQHVASDHTKLAGVVVNKVKDLDEFNDTHRQSLQRHDIPILGALPRRVELTRFPVGFLAEQLFARVVAGEDGLQHSVARTFVATTAVQSAMRNPEFSGADTLVVTSGDRSDMIVAALNADTAGILLTDDIAPPANIISEAEHKKIPLLLVRQSTAQTVRVLNELDPLLTRNDRDKADLLGQLVRDHVKLDFLDD